MKTIIKIVFYLALATGSLLALESQDVRYMNFALLIMFAYFAFSFLGLLFADGQRRRLRRLLREIEKDIVNNGEIGMKNQSALEEMQREYQSDMYRQYLRDEEIRKRFN